MNLSLGNIFRDESPARVHFRPFYGSEAQENLVENVAETRQRRLL